MSAFNACKSAPAVEPPAKDLADQVNQVTAAMKDLAEAGRAEELPDEALECLAAAVVLLYSQKAESRETIFPLHQVSGASATSVLMTTTAMLKGSNLELFELGMWQSWSGMK